MDERDDDENFCHVPPTNVRTLESEDDLHSRIERLPARS